MRLAFYTTPSGRRPVIDYIKKQAKHERASLVEALEMIEIHGFEAPRMSFRQIRGKLWEIKIERKLSHRIFYAAVVKEEIVLLHAYQKKSQKAPKKEIDLAQKRMKEITG
jgi:phage-related protein